MEEWSAPDGIKREQLMKELNDLLSAAPEAALAAIIEDRWNDLFLPVLNRTLGKGGMLTDKRTPQQQNGMVSKIEHF